MTTWTPSSATGSTDSTAQIILAPHAIDEVQSEAGTPFLTNDVYVGSNGGGTRLLAQPILVNATAVATDIVVRGRRLSGANDVAAFCRVSLYQWATV